MISEEEAQRIDQYSVWNARQKYSDQDLWEWLLRLHDRELEILQMLPLAYKRAFSDAPNYRELRKHWEQLVVELHSQKPLVDAIAWHLTQRSDPYIAKWIADSEEYKRANANLWQRATLARTH